LGGLKLCLGAKHTQALPWRRDFKWRRF